MAHVSTIDALSNAYWMWVEVIEDFITEHYTPQTFAIDVARSFGFTLTGHDLERNLMILRRDDEALSIDEDGNYGTYEPAQAEDAQEI